MDIRVVVKREGDVIKVTIGDKTVDLPSNSEKFGKKYGTEDSYIEDDGIVIHHIKKGKRPVVLYEADSDSGEDMVGKPQAIMKQLDAGFSGVIVSASAAGGRKKSSGFKKKARRSNGNVRRTKRRQLRNLTTRRR